ncbi:PilZ domain-containing protein [Acidovorax sp.]|uniref:PilZ domain-containing protein n=1 Tax=Acidovorax sp. TaxID=1872122 RepID=UPI00262F648B|nr:PilZ domain-containing protein [Acidovorax sp.]
MPHERRHFVRVSFDAPALLTTARDAFSVHVLDLSLKGALITIPAQAELEPGMLCQITIPLAETGNHIAMSTEVAHMQGLHTGLLCHAIDLDSVTHLRRLIELQLGDPALLERDLGELTSASP